MVLYLVLVCSLLSNQLVQATPAGTLPIPSILWDSLTNRPTPNQQLRSQRSPCQSNNPCKNNDPGFMNTVNTNYMPINVETIAQTTYQTDEKETTTQQNDDENGSSSKQKTTSKADPSTVPKPQDEIATEEEEEEEEEKKQNTAPSQQETEGTAPSPLSSSKSSILSPSPSSQSSVFSSIAPSPSSIQSIQSKKITNPNSRDWNLHKPKKCTTRDIVADAQRFSNIGFDSVPMYKIGQCISKCTEHYRGKEEVECFDACVCRGGIEVPSREDKVKSCNLPENLLLRAEQT